MVDESPQQICAPRQSHRRRSAPCHHAGAGGAGAAQYAATMHDSRRRSLAGKYRRRHDGRAGAAEGLKATGHTASPPASLRHRGYTGHMSMRRPIACHVQILTRPLRGRRIHPLLNEDAYMANNVFISYDLYQSKEIYELVRTLIEGMGEWSRFHLSLWFVKTELSAQDVATKIQAAMESNDKLIVVDASHNTAYWYGLPEEASNFLADKWPK